MLVGLITTPTPTPHPPIHHSDNEKVDMVCRQAAVLAPCGFACHLCKTEYEVSPVKTAVGFKPPNKVQVRFELLTSCFLSPVPLQLGHETVPADLAVRRSPRKRQAWGRYHGGRPPSSDDSFHSPIFILPSALDKPSIMKCCHRRRTCSHTSPRRSPTMATLHDARFVECQWWNDGWTVKTVVT